jgi:threonine dehydrogenase-like Zn-dependent dehydrogenase
MRATLIYGAGDIRVETVPDPRIEQPTDAIVRVLVSCICGSDLHPYHNRPAATAGTTIGHEFLGVVEDLGRDVTGLRKGDVVIAPFVWSDNTCDFCREGLHTSCRNGGRWNLGGVGGGQAEAVRVPQAAGTLVPVPVSEDSPLLASLLTLSDVYCTGWHAAVTAGVSERTTVTVVGDGAVGLSAVLAARQLGAEQIILMGRHKDRTDLGREFGATDVVAERGEEGAAAVLNLTGGDGTHTVIEAVGYKDAYDTALNVVRAGGTVSRVGAPQYAEGDISFSRVFFRNVKITGGAAPARAYIEQLLPAVLDGTVEPGKVFDRTVGIDEVPDGYRAMNDRQAIKVLIRP